jgi:hypothetical protein
MGPCPCSAAASLPTPPLSGARPSPAVKIFSFFASPTLDKFVCFFACRLYVQRTALLFLFDSLKGAIVVKFDAKLGVVIARNTHIITSVSFGGDCFPLIWSV